MKTLLWVLVLVLGIGVLVAGQSARAETIKMAWFVLPPHMYPDEGSGQPRGAGIAYFEAVAAKMGYTVEWVGPFPLNRFADTVHNARGGVVGQLFGVRFPMYEPYLHFTDVPFYEMQASLAVRQDNPLTAIHTIDDIEGYRIGFTSGAGGYTPFLEAHRDQLHFEELFGDDWMARNLRMLADDRVDAVFDRNAHALPFAAAQLKLDTQIKILPLPDEPIGAYVAFSKAAPQHDRLVEAYNAAVKSVDFSYDDFLAKEF